MINIILGENSSGKTVYLNNLVDKFGKGNTVTNLPWKRSIIKRNISKEKVELLESLFSCEFNIVGDRVFTTEFDTGEAFIEVISDLCSINKYFVYDEPDLYVKESFKSLVYDAIAKLGNTFEECWVVSHFSCVTAISYAKYWKITDKNNITEIELEEAFEVLDPF